MQPSRLVWSVVIVIVVGVSAVFAITKYSDAQETTTCPDGTELAADGTSCLSDAVDDNVTTTTSCTQGVLSDDGQFCIVPRLDAPANPAAPPADAPVPTFTG